MSKKLLAFFTGISVILFFVGFFHSAIASYGCLSGNGDWSCSPGDKADCSDVKSSSGESYCLKSAPGFCQIVDGSKCGKQAYETYQQCIEANKNKTPDSGAYNGDDFCSQFASSSSDLDRSGGSDLDRSGGSDLTRTGGSSTNTPDIDCKKNADACLFNPLPTKSLLDMFLIITRVFLYMTGIVSVIFIIIGGFRMVLAQGDEEAHTTAKKTVTWAVLGLVIALLSFSIIAIVQSLLGASLPLVNK